MLVVAVDTGRTCGIAQWDTEWPDGPKFQAWQMPGWDGVRLIIEDFDSLPDILVVERLTIQQRSTRTKGEVLEAVEQLGALRLWTMQRPEIELQLQNPSDAMSFAPDAKLRRGNFWVPGKEHARDAARHLLLALVRNQLYPDPASLIEDA